MLTVRDLHVRYGTVAAVRGLNLDVAQGEIVALVGANGAGKTSTLAAISGALRPAGGTITFDGHDISATEPENIVRRGVAMVPEGRHVFGTLSVAENLRLGATVRKPGRALEADIERELERFPVLRRYYKANAGKLSGGEQQQLVIARALLSNPRLLLLDEPSLGLAPLLVDMVFGIVTELQEQGVTVLLVEQNATRAVELADRSYVLRKGEIAASGERADFVARADLTSLYFGSERAR